MYVFCCFDRSNKYDEEFWINDIISVFERILLLKKYKAIPFLMRYKKHKTSPFFGLYSVIASWLNNPSFYKKITLREFCFLCQKAVKSFPCAELRYLFEFEEKYPNIAKQYFDFSY